MILELLAAFGIAAVGRQDYEADDVIGTLATREPGPVEVATGDRDLFQVVDDAAAVRVLYCGKGVAKLEVFDDAAVQAKYGVPAARYADFAALRGDPSDGLPGVPGVGEKTAARLVARYGGLDAHRRRRSTTPPPASLPGCGPSWPPPRDYLAVAPTVVRVARDVAAAARSTPTLPARPRDPDRLMELAEQWGVAGRGAPPGRRRRAAPSRLSADGSRATAVERSAASAGAAAEVAPTAVSGRRRTAPAGVRHRTSAAAAAGDSMIRVGPARPAVGAGRLSSDDAAAR